VIFMPISEAIRRASDLVKKYLARCARPRTNFFATLNSAVFSDGFVLHVPPGCAARWELSTLFPHQRAQHRAVRTHADHRRQGAYVSYLEGCTRRARREPAACRVVELVTLDDAESNIDGANWYRAIPKARGRHLPISSPSARLPPANIRRFLDPRSETGICDSPLEISRAASCARG